MVTPLNVGELAAAFAAGVGAAWAKVKKAGPESHRIEIEAESIAIRSLRGVLKELRAEVEAQRKATEEQRKANDELRAKLSVAESTVEKMLEGDGPAYLS